MFIKVVPQMIILVDMRGLNTVLELNFWLWYFTGPVVLEFTGPGSKVTGPLSCSR